jgi:hypothetical protein
MIAKRRASFFINVHGLCPQKKAAHDGAAMGLGLMLGCGPTSARKNFRGIFCAPALRPGRESALRWHFLTPGLPLPRHAERGQRPLEHVAGILAVRLEHGIEHVFRVRVLGDDAVWPPR